MKQGLWVPSNARIVSISSDGFESPSPGRLNKAVARTHSDISKVEVKKVLIVLNLYLSGGKVRMDCARVAVVESNVATTW